MIRRALAALVVVAGAVVLPVTPAQAVPYCGVKAQCGIYFFAEPTKIHLVGEYIVFCGGAILEWGTQTPYQISHDIPCDEQ